MTAPSVRNLEDGERVELAPGDRLVCDAADGSLAIVWSSGRTINLNRFAEVLGDSSEQLKGHLTGINQAAFWALATIIATTHGLTVEAPVQHGSEFRCELVLTRTA